MSNDMAISCESGFAVDALEEVRPAAPYLSGEKPPRFGR